MTTPDITYQGELDKTTVAYKITDIYNKLITSTTDVAGLKVLSDFTGVNVTGVQNLGPVEGRDLHPSGIHIRKLFEQRLRTC